MKNSDIVIWSRLCLALAMAWSYSGCSAEAGSGAGAGGVGGVAGTGGGAAIDSGKAELKSDSGPATTGGTGGAPPLVVLDSGAKEKTCAAISKVADKVVIETTEIKPVALYVMLDCSGSMAFSLPSKWQAAVDALKAFVNDPNSAGIDIALQYFPGTGDCAGVGYDTPAVPMGKLPDHAADISASLDAQLMGIMGTPMEGGLRGALSYCTKFKQDTAANPEGEDCVVVLATDGEPNGCTVNDGPGLAQIAADAYAANQITTFAVGMAGADFTVMNLIGQSGHGDCTPADATTWACDVSGNAASFLDAMKLIRDTVVKTETIVTPLDCEWQIPAPPEDEKLDFDKINVQFSATGLAADTQVLGRAQSADQCGDKMGWYYDNPDTPTRIIACESACNAIKAAVDGKVDILLGCQYIPLE